MTIETNSLALKQMINKQWKVLWELIELIEDIRVKLHSMQGQVIHTFREGNTVADALANEVTDSQEKKEYHCFNELPANIRKCINIDKAQIPNLRIRTRKINIQ
uniref:Putative ovule protein n=1 Tax=Solanum chacoense TaxID=4108 RepID=A0A0V0H132_SOLCH